MYFNNSLLKVKCLICLIILLSFFILKKNNQLIYNKIIDYSKNNINLVYISYLYRGDLNNYESSVSSDSNIFVYDVVDYNNSLSVFPFTNDVFSPIEGLVVKTGDSYIVVQATDSYEYIISNLDCINVLMYEYIYFNQNIGSCDKSFSISYLDTSLIDIFSNLSYIVDYEEA